MEPIKINVNVEVGLKQTTIEALAAIFNPLKGCSCCNFEPDPQPESKGKAKKTVPAPEPEVPAQDPAPAPVDDDDLPPAEVPASTAKSLPSEADARQAVKAAKDRKVPATDIKAFMKDSFGIASSVECPAERRQELIDGLNKLTA